VNEDGARDDVARATEDGAPTTDDGPQPGPAPQPGPLPPREPRPWLERLGLAAVALVLTALFAIVAVAAGAGGEWILAAMSTVGALMTIAAAAITVVRG
jgi:hypothetical protein